LALLVTILHIYTSYRFTDDSEYANVSIIPFLVDNTINVTGLIATGGLIILIASSAFSRVIRHYIYQSWLVVHILSAIAVLVGLILHHVTIAIFIALWWTLDLVIVRYLIQANCLHKCTTATLRLIDHRPGRRGTAAQSYEPSVEISIDNRNRSVQFSAGQYARIAIPAINGWEFHPLSISSAPHEDYLTFHVRNRGDWTSQLVALANATTTTTTTTVLLEGPYGAPSIDYDDDRHYRYFLLIGGGIGITPLQSIGKNLLYQRAKQNRNLQCLRYVWSVRDLQIVDDIPPLGRSSPMSDDNDIDNDNDGQVVQVDVYCTRSTSSSLEDAAESSSSSDNPRPRPYNVHVGRPDLDSIFTEMKAQVIANSSSKQKRDYSGGREASVAVIACGPAPLLHDVERLCRLYSPSIVNCGRGGAGCRRGGDNDNNVAVYFDLHQEHFEF
jgi:predicted ferric reductase